jgi:hypothetical protein
MASSDLVANFPIQTLLRGREPGELQCPTVGRLPLWRYVSREVVEIGLGPSFEEAIV